MKVSRKATIIFCLWITFILAEIGCVAYIIHNPELLDDGKYYYKIDWNNFSTTTRGLHVEDLQKDTVNND